MLNIKRQLEKSKKNDLSIALKRIEDEKNILISMETEREDHIDNVKKFMLKGTSVQYLKDYNVFLNYFDEKIDFQKKIVNDVNLVADNIREELVQLSKEKKMLETLREKKFEEYKAELQKKEELEVSEIVNYRYIDSKVGE